MTTVYSFSYRYGSHTRIPLQEERYILDCRVLTNPYTGGGETGLDRRIADRVFSNPKAAAMAHAAAVWGREHPEGQILVGCTFGRHRSVAMAERIAEILGVKAHHTSRRMRGA